jgi:hypothetical protein
MLTNRKKNKRFAKRLILFLVIVSLLIPSIIVGNDNDSNYNYSYNSYDSTYPEPKTQGFSKDLYTPILEEEKHGLGSINVTDLDLQDIGLGFNSTDDVAYSNYDKDLTSKALNMSYKGTKFIKTEKIAQVGNLNENITDFEKIVVKLNETLSIQYNESTEGFLIYASKLTPCKLIQLSVENNTRIIENIHESNYSINEIDGIDFLNFNFKNYFKQNNLNFTMHMIWQYNFTIENWQMSQYFKPELIITEEDNIIYPKFNYYFQIKGLKYIKTNESIIYQEIPADDLWIKNLTINLPDKNLLSSHYLILNQEVIPTNDFLAPDKSVFTNSIRANTSTIDLDFTTYFSIEFVEPVDYTWGIDRLVEDQDIRERIYFPKITSGPSNIFLKYIKILEETISFDQVISSTSLFKRILSYTEINVSEFEEELINSLIFHQFATKRQGIKITMPYMIKGETCPFTIKYETTKDLRIIVTDNINMPLSNFEVVIYYYGEKYGTYVSKEKTQPLGPSITDENGEVLIEDVPNGNYTIKIFPRNSDDLIIKAEVSSFLDINYVVTPVIHFPLLILILGGICGILLGIGLKINRKREM